MSVSVPTSAAESLSTSPGRLRRAAVSGSRWGVLSGIVEQAGTTVTTIVLARLLTPLDFGLVAAATVAVGFFSLLTRFGFGAALVNREEMDDRVASTNFWLALAIGVVVTVAAAVFSSFVASLVGHPEAAGLVAVASLSILFAQLSNVSQALLLRALRFGIVYSADMVAIVSYSIAAIALAAATDLGAWAIIVGRVASVVARTMVLLIGGRWRPRLVLDPSVIREDLRFNLGFIATTASGFASKNADYWVLGRTASSGALGAYYVAYVLPNVLRQRMNWLATEVLFPVLSRVRDRTDAMLRAYTEVVQLLAFIAFPALFGIATLSGLVVEVLFGPRWSQAVAPLAVLSVSAAIETVTQVGTTVFLAQGKPGRGVVVNVVRLITLAAGLVLAVLLGGLPAVAWAVFASTVASAVVAQGILAPTIGMAHRRFGNTLAPVAIPTVVMVVVVVTTKAAVADQLPAIAALVSLAGLGAAAYFAAGLLCFRSAFLRMLAQLKELARRG